MSTRRQLLVAIITLFIITVLTLGSAVMQNDMQAGVRAMARYYPADTWLFAAIRLDDAYIETLDGIIGRITEPLAALQAPLPSLSAIISETPTAAAVVDWAGDHAAIGISGDPGRLVPSDIVITVEVDDPAAALAFLREQFPFSEQLDGDGYTGLVDQGASIFIFTDHLMIYGARVDAPRPVLSWLSARTLETSADFTTALDALPEPGYNALAFIQPTAFVSMLAPTSSIPLDLTPTAVGLTITADTTLVIDGASLPGSGIITTPPTPDPAFIRYVPADANAFVLAHSLSNLINSGLTAAALIQADSRLPDPRTTVSDALGSLGLDLQRDILDWMTGDYAVFARLDVVPVAAGLVQSRLNLDDNFDFGLVIDATADPNLARRLAARLGGLIGMASASSDGAIAVSSDTIAGQDVTLITISGSQPAAPGEMIRQQIALGATDAVFFLASPAYAEAIITGGPSLLTSPVYADAAAHLLPNASSVWYADSDGFILGALVNPISPVLALTLLGPSVQTVFDDIVAQLSATGPLPTATPTPTPQPTPNAEQALAQVAPLGALLDQIAHSTMSASVDVNGVSRLRLTLTLAR